MENTVKYIERKKTMRNAKNVDNTLDKGRNQTKYIQDVNKTVRENRMNEHKETPDLSFKTQIRQSKLRVKPNCAEKKRRVNRSRQDRGETLLDKL